MKTLLFRAYHLSSDYLSLNVEIKYLRFFLLPMAIPVFYLMQFCKQFLNKIFLKKAKPITVPKQKIYCSLPYYNTNSENMAKLFKNIIHEFFPQVQLQISLTNSFTMGLIFSFKDKLHRDLRANIIYKYECSDDGKQNISYTSLCNPRHSALPCISIK